MVPDLLIPVSESSQVGEVRRAAADVAQRAGLDQNAAGKLAIIVTELAKNLVRYAQAGRILLQALPAPAEPEVQVLSIDDGPGFDLHRAMADGYSTGGTPGNGMGAIKRLASSFDAYSTPQGSVLMARVANLARPAASFRAGSIVLSAPGETVSGDASRFLRNENRAAFMVADGLGHGLQAAAAADGTLDVFDNNPFLEPAAFIEASHRALCGTRGAALAIAQLDFTRLRLAFAGVGNISGFLLSTTTRQGLASHNGIVGENLLRVKPFEYPLPLNGTLIMHSDGLQQRWSMDPYPGLLHNHPAVIAGTLFRDFYRGRDDVTLLVASWQGDAP